MCHLVLSVSRNKPVLYNSPRAAIVASTTENRLGLFTVTLRHAGERGEELIQATGNLKFESSGLSIGKRNTGIY